MDKAKLDRWFKPLKRERASSFVSPFICVCGRQYKRIRVYNAHRRKFNCQQAVALKIEDMADLDD